MIIAIIIAVIILVAAAIEAILIADKTYKVTCYHSDEDKARHNNPHNEFDNEQYKDITPIMHKLITNAEAEPFEALKIISSHDRTKLYGRLYKYSDKPVVNIFFHGYHSTALRDGCGGLEMSKDAKINAILVDQRANGLSGGNVITFGILERLDCRDWVNFAVEKFGKDVKIVLSGVSLGAATVLTASDLDMPNVKCIIADCGFSSPKEIICKVAKDNGYPAAICWPLLKISCRLRGHFNIGETSAMEAVGRTKIPILIIHGDDDRYVPFEMGEKLYKACASEKAFLRVKDAPHAASYIVDKSAYTKASREFIEKYCG